MKDLKKMMGKEDDSGHDMKRDAKLKVLQELRKMASGMMGDDVHGGMKKVSVAAPDKAGLKKGLQTAEQMMSKGGLVEDFHKSNPMTEGSLAEEAEESPEEADSEGDESLEEHLADSMDDGSEDLNSEHSPEELDREIERLKMLKERALAMKK